MSPFSKSSSHTTIFSRLSLASSSSRSVSSTSSVLPPITSGFADIQHLRYAKDGKGYDFSTSYPYSHVVSTSSEEVPVPCQSYQRALYAKDGKGFDFTSSYPYWTSYVSPTSAVVPRGLRYAKDGKGHDFSASYPYDKQ